MRSLYTTRSCAALPTFIFRSEFCSFECAGKSVLPQLSPGYCVSHWLSISSRRYQSSDFLDHKLNRSMSTHQCLKSILCRGILSISSNSDAENSSSSPKHFQNEGCGWFLVKLKVMSQRCRNVSQSAA